MSRQRWDSTATATVQSDGTAVATISSGTRASWPYLVITGTSVRTTTGRSDAAKAYLFRDVVDGVLLGTTDRGGASSSRGDTFFGQSGVLVARWTGATPGDIATLYAEGYRTDDADG